MNKKLLIGILIFILLCVSGYFIISKNADTSSMLADTSPTVSNTESQSTFLDLLTTDSGKTCTYSSNITEDTSIAGTLYASAGKFRGDAQTTVADGTVISNHFLYINPNFYTWTDASSKGLLMKVDNFGTEDTSDAQNESIDSLESANFDCTSWNVSQSMFDVPQDVDFVDFSQQMDSMMENKCSACDFIPEGDQKTQCLQALGC